MDVNVQHKEEKPLLHRSDVRVRVAYEGATPSRTTLKETVAGVIKAPVEHVVIRQIKTEFGKQAATINVSVYKDVESLNQFEPRHMKKRHGMAVEEKKTAAAGGK